MKLKVNNVKGFSGTIEIEDSNGIPVERFWRNRLKDAEIDNCCEVIDETKPSERKTAKAAKTEGIVELLP